jgi:hypothetical protein
MSRNDKNCLDIDVGTKNFFEVSHKQLYKMTTEKVQIRLVDGDNIIKIYKNPECVSAIAALAQDNNCRIFVKNLDDLMKTIKYARFWNSKRMASEQKKRSA